MKNENENKKSKDRTKNIIQYISVPPISIGMGLGHTYSDAHNWVWPMETKSESEIGGSIEILKSSRFGMSVSGIYLIYLPVAPFLYWFPTNRI